jgi:hypothetical protein
MTSPPSTESPQSPGFSPELVRSLSLQQQAALAAALTPKWNKYLQRRHEEQPLFPSVRQQAFLLTDSVEDVLFGGAAGGGKSEALIAAAAQYVDVPGYAALMFRRTVVDLKAPDALIPRSHEWFGGTDAHWNGNDLQWTFPSGAVLKFGYLQHAGDATNYQGAAAQCYCFDEAGQIAPAEMMYLKTRARRRKGVLIPIRFRYSANPGGVAHEWLVSNFVLGAPTNGKLFVPSKAVDNPGLDLEYLKRLEAVDDPVLKAQMLEGDWGALDRSDLICPEWTPAAEAAFTATEDHLPAFFTGYAGGDPGGSRDLFAMLWGYLDFIAGVLFITDERAWRNPDTETIGTEAVAVEAERFGAARAEKRMDAFIRVTDLDARLVNDLKKPPYLLSWVHTEKADAAVWERQLRTAIKQGRLRIHARCQRLLRTLKYGRYNDNRTDYERTEETGHADLWKALCYLFRAVNWQRNPYPPAPFLPEHGHMGRSPQPRSQAQRAVKGAFRTVKPL